MLCLARVWIAAAIGSVVLSSRMPRAGASLSLLVCPCLMSFPFFIALRMPTAIVSR